MARPALRARSGKASSAAPAPPKRLVSERKVRGPMPSLRIRRSQSRRWRSESTIPAMACAQPFWPILPSRPASSRAMFSRCMIQSSTERQAMTSAVWGSPKAIQSSSGETTLAVRAESEE